MGIVNSDISWADKVQMMRDTLKYEYRNSPEFQGWIQSLNGGLEVLGGIGLASLPGGMVPGVPVIVHGADTFVAGQRRRSGEQDVNTLTYELINAATGSPWLADTIDRGIPFVGGVTGVGRTFNAVRAGSAARIPLLMSEVNSSAGTTVLTASEIRQMVRGNSTMWGSTGIAYNVNSREELWGLYGRITAGSSSTAMKDYPGMARVLPDGTKVGLRMDSKFGGNVIDIFPSKGRPYKVHIQ